MQINFEQFAATSLMGSEESPPRSNGTLQFSQAWEETAFGIAIALAKKGYYEWEDFRQELIAVIGDWEGTHDCSDRASAVLRDRSWNYYQMWLLALEHLAIEAEIIDEAELEKRTFELINCKK